MWVAAFLAANPSAHARGFGRYIDAVKAHHVAPGDRLTDSHVQACLAECEAIWRAQGETQSAEDAARAAIDVMMPRPQPMPRTAAPPTPPPPSPTTDEDEIPW